NISSTAQGGSIAQYIRAAQPLTVVTPSDPRFDEQVALYFNAIEDAAYQTIRPYLVFVVNNEPVEARAYALRWTYVYPDGRTTDSIYSFFTTRLDDRPGASKILKAGAARLISPLFNISAARWNSDSTLRNQFGSEYGSRFAHYQPPGTRVSVKLDGVVYLDDSFSGPNKSMVLQRYLCRVNGEHDEVVGEEDAIRSGATAGTIDSALTSDVRRGRFDIGTYLPARYVRARGRAALRLREILRRQGFARFQSMVAFLATHAPPAGKMTFMAPWYSPTYRYQPPSK
ncbi:MAG TPA: hypothetical protein VNJ12_05205, partial [Candidatus Dormibacteraeota bacterium]|nr:hypothetical protein [Candidatus Dormibacteraeota bacterium]